MVKCPRCKGSGKVEPYKRVNRADASGRQYFDAKSGGNPMSDVCQTCDGRGEIHERSKIKWDIGQAERAGEKDKAAKLYTDLADFDRKQREPEVVSTEEG